MQQYKICPLCGSREIFRRITCTDHLVSGESFEIFSCSNCTGSFTMNHPGKEEIGRYYSSADYISHTDSSRNILELIYQVVRNITLASKRRLVSKYSGKKKGVTVDIGCGTGHFVKEMKDAGWQSLGIEIDESARKYGAQKHNIDILHPDAVNGFETSSFDTVTLWHVLEHFDDPASWLGETGRILKPDGVLFVALPNSDSCDAAFYGEKWAAWDVPRHIWHFNPASFEKFALLCGFRLIEKRSMPFDVFYISLLTEKQSASKFGFLKGITRGVTCTLKTGFKADLSSSVTYVLKKV